MKKFLDKITTFLLGVGLVGAAIAVPFLFTGVDHELRNLENKGVMIEGTVCGARRASSPRRSEFLYLEYEFKANGILYRGSDDVPKPVFERYAGYSVFTPGPILVRYLPSDPKVSRIADRSVPPPEEKSPWMAWLLAVMAGGCGTLLLASLSGAKWARPRRSES